TWTASYDAAGDMTCRAPTSTATCTAAPSGAQLSYAANGSASAWQNVPTNPTLTAGFLYDGQGNRVEQQVTQNGTTTTTVYVGNLEQLISTGSTTTTQTYYYANGIRIAMASNGAFSYLAGDSLGSVQSASSSDGLSTSYQLFDPYGQVRYSIGTIPTDYGFTGRHADSISGLDYYNARYYDPAAGQFTSPDPILPGDGYDVFGLSRYAYVEGNPETRIDPSGNVVQCADTCGGGDPVTIGTGTNDTPEYIPPTGGQVGSSQPAVDNTKQAYEASLAKVKGSGVSLLLTTDRIYGGGWNGLGDDTQMALYFLAGGGTPDKWCSSAKCAAGMRKALDYVTDLQSAVAWTIVLNSVSWTGPTLRPDITLGPGGRSGEKVKGLQGPPNSLVRGSPGRIYLTDADGRVIADITRGRVKLVRPGVGFIDKRTMLTEEELEWLEQMWPGRR
ncbi:MAG TPA: RHS repeat-associated core domain-containing protein, partial [Candidatus Dormibacteraeota bacterium]|nr:RHS repeat-associated core domain-containing protein [Candidatus Dormibacteraeota bacterium]